MKHKLLFVTLIALLLTSVALISAEGVNWCEPGQPWGDGRCNNPDPNIAAYYWQMGWAMANNTEPSSVESSNVSGDAVAVDDFYSWHKEGVKCHYQQYFDASEGVLANDLGEGIEVIDYTGLSSPHGDLMVWSDGSFRYSSLKNGGDYKFHYTITGGDTAKVTIHLCETDFQKSEEPVVEPKS